MPGLWDWLCESPHADMLFMVVRGWASHPGTGPPVHPHAPTRSAASKAPSAIFSGQPLTDTEQHLQFATVLGKGSVHCPCKRTPVAACPHFHESVFRP